jgi:histidyl-tRNA synthetase
MHSKPQPISVWYYCPMFRHDRPQAGRYRQFHQFGCETLGSNDPAIDAELIAIAYNYLLDLGVQSNVHINSIGTPSDRERYIVELVGYLRSKRSYLSEESKKRILKNPLRVLDSKEEEDKKVIEEAPQIIDWLSEESRQYFMKVLEYLDEMSIPYVLKPTLVRGLDYYTDTVFELVESEAAEESQNALGGGGRYNLLVEQLGGPSTPSAGFSIGLERALQASKRAKEKKAGQEQETKDTTPKLFFAHLGEQARRKTLVLIEQLRRENIFLKHSIGKPSLKAQLEMADKYGSTHTVILGQKELQDGTIIIRDMASGIQEIIDQKRLKKELGKILDIEKI